MPEDIFKQAEVPPQLWERASKINTERETLSQEIEKIQSECLHDWQKITWRDPKYSPRLDGLGEGQFDVIKEHHCIKCNSHKKFERHPWVICHLCGGNMKFMGRAQIGMGYANVHKCETCSHEYDTT